jgi:hypothetical protein
LLLALLAVVGGVWVATRGTFAKPQIRHVIRISLDTTRADRISCLGYPRPSAPNIDSPASQGYLFTYAQRPASQFAVVWAGARFCDKPSGRFRSRARSAIWRAVVNCLPRRPESDQRHHFWTIALPI